MPGKVSMRLWAVGFLLGLITILCLPATTAADECEFLGRFKTLHDLIPDEVGGMYGEREPYRKRDISALDERNLLH